MLAQERDHLLRSMPAHQRKLYDKHGVKRKSRTNYHKHKNERQHPPPKTDRIRPPVTPDDLISTAARAVRTLSNKEQEIEQDSREFPDIMYEEIDTGADDYDQQPYQSIDTQETFGENDDGGITQSPTDEQLEVDSEIIDPSKVLHSPERRLNMRHKTFFCSAPSEYTNSVYYLLLLPAESLAHNKTKP